MSVDPHVIPVILSGGTGTRLWPLSRALYPKQLLPLLSEVSLLQQTAWRVNGHGFDRPVVVCSDEHRFIIAEQLRDLGIVPRAIILEPVARDTAAAVAAASALVTAADPDALMLVLPSDHAIADTDAFHAAIRVGAQVAGDGHVVAFGAPPAQPETGFGYIRRGPPLDAAPEVFAVDRFVEKPDEASTRRFLAEGDWLWNCGMFLFRPRLYLEELARFAPEVAEPVARAVREAKPDLDFVRLAAAPFAEAPAVSVDRAVMEHTALAAVVPTDFGWSDVGSWSALWQMGERDPDGNVAVGDVVTRDSENCYLRGDGVLLATVGLRDTVVVATSDVVLVADRAHDQDVREVVAGLKSQGRPEALCHPVVYRPWGSYEAIDAGPGYQVKQITVKPGHRLSLQRHSHRAEHWVIISGVADVVRGEDRLTLRERESIDVPVGCVHRLANPGPDILQLIEVQTGSYLGEDDIVRLDDAYGRCPADASRASDEHV